MRDTIYTTEEDEEFGRIEREAAMRKEAVSAALGAPAPVQVSPIEFVTLVQGKEHLVGRPTFWAVWPSKDKNT